MEKEGMEIESGDFSLWPQQYLSFCPPPLIFRTHFAVAACVSSLNDTRKHSRGSSGKPRSKRRLPKKQSSRRQQEEEEEDGDAESEGDEEEDEDEEEGDEEEEEEGAGVLSAHVERSRRMKSKISDQERELLAEKPWALRGEVHSHDRPQNRCVLCMVQEVVHGMLVIVGPTALIRPVH